LLLCRLAGAVTNYAPPPQLVEPGYENLAGLDAFARRRAAEYDGRALDVQRLTGFCLLVPRGVMAKVGRLDEQFGLGFFDDDDLCLRARRAGFSLTVALDCYVHHFGSQTFRAMGVDAVRQLQDNLALYRAKWGAEEAAKYRMPTPGVVAPASYQPVTVLSDAPLIVPAVPRGKARVSLTMIVKNEEQNLPECLASVRDLVDEAVVIDTGSTDRTRDVIRSYGCVEGEFPWVDDFAAARNAALDRATGDYAFWMDADDRLDPDNRAALKTLLANLRGGNDAYAMKCLCVPDKPGAGATMVDHVRLFRRLAEHRWKYRVHEQILGSLRATGASVTWTGVTVRHVGYMNPAVRRRKLDRDLRLLKLDHAEHPSDPFTLFNLGSVFNELGDYRAAADALSKSLAASHVKDSIVRKLYALLFQCHGKAGDRNKAAEVLKEGRAHYPDDAELLFLAANLARERQDYRGAEALSRRLIDGTDADHFGSVDAGLRAVKGRHNLAVMLLDLNRGAESEGLWRAALVADPLFLPAHAGLGELYLKTANAAGVAAQAATPAGTRPRRRSRGPSWWRWCRSRPSIRWTGRSGDPTGSSKSPRARQCPRPSPRRTGR
jgi:glycosyltransferase involved in cell wall biosynthesis